MPRRKGTANKPGASSDLTALAEVLHQTSLAYSVDPCTFRAKAVTEAAREFGRASVINALLQISPGLGQAMSESVERKARKSTGAPIGSCEACGKVFFSEVGRVKHVCPSGGGVKWPSPSSVAALRKKGYSWHDIAERVGVSEWTVRHRYSGKRKKKGRS